MCKPPPAGSVRGCGGSLAPRAWRSTPSRIPRRRLSPTRYVRRHRQGDLLLVPESSSFRAQPCEWVALEVSEAGADLGLIAKLLLRGSLYAAKYSFLVGSARALRTAMDFSY